MTQDGLRSRVEELRARYRALKPDGLSPPELVEQIGTFLRRSSHLELTPSAFDVLLRQVSVANIETMISWQHADKLRQTLDQAFRDAFSSGLADTEEERTSLAESAWSGLCERERVAAWSAALSRWGSLATTPQTAVEDWQHGLSRLDDAFRPRARQLVPLNLRRRAERDLLDSAHWPTSWWFTARADCDGLVLALAGEQAMDAAHLARCRDCASDLERSSVVDAPPGRHLSEDEAWAYDLGTLPAGDRARIRAHAEECRDCTQVLYALSQGDEAMDEALDWLEGPLGNFGPERRARLREGRRVIAEAREFRLMAARGHEGLRLIVQPLGHRGLAAVAVVAGGKAFHPRPSAEGLEFDLGHRRTGELVRVRIQATADSEPFERELHI